MGHIIPGSSGHVMPSMEQPNRRALFSNIFQGTPRYESVLQEHGKVEFPEFLGERLYMIAFRKGSPLPKILRRWKKTIDAMLAKVTISKKVELYFMADEAYVQKGTPHRRPGPHIDGHWSTTGTLQHYDETILLASSVAGCYGYVGPYYGEFGPGGDVTKMDLSKLDRLMMKSNRVYAGNVTMVHESIPLKESCQRTLVRINVPGHILLKR